MLKNVISVKCSNSTKNAPYFSRAKDGTDTNQDLLNELNHLNTLAYIPFEDIKYGDNFPDGAITFYDANPKNFSYRLQINDVKKTEYHRSNGVTKFVLRDKNDTSKTYPVKLFGCLINV